MGTELPRTIGCSAAYTGLMLRTGNSTPIPTSSCGHTVMQTHSSVPGSPRCPRTLGPARLPPGTAP